MEEFNRKSFMLAMNQAKRLTTEKFIEKGKQIYGDRFDYSETEYLTARDKITIICPEHGSFTVLPQHHIRGRNTSGGCRKCGLKAINRNRKLTQEQFLERVKNIEGLSFDKTVYVDKRKKVIVTCKIHGDYKTSAEILLKGNGCKKCASIKLQADRIKDTEYFIERAKLIHKTSYDYSNSIYKGIFNPVLIKCNNCGIIFSQQPHVHFKGSGCPMCSSSKGEKKIKEILENLEISFITQKTFKGLVFERPLKFDFYLTEYNSCIEFDGEQHFKAVNYWEGEKGLEKYRIKDDLKSYYCQVNNMPLLRIRFDEQNIEDKIRKFLKKQVL